MVHKWRTGHTYAVGDLVTYHGYYYKVLQAHTSESDWVPDKNPEVLVQQGQCDTFFSSPQDKEHLKNAHDEVTNAPHQVCTERSRMI
ncbi:hypothetical protein FRB93_005532 [Tulasnella sp. JGI-2019a]|nr:hypothetical protein FRB93_005532 [Tulasnella sp. JGI-2019a]